MRDLNTKTQQTYYKVSYNSTNAIRREMLLRKGAFLRSLIGMRKVTRVHCVFDTNIKMKIINKKTNQIVFGSSFDEKKSDDLNRYEKRLITFECQDKGLIEKPIAFDIKML